MKNSRNLKIREKIKEIRDFFSAKNNRELQGLVLDHSFFQESGSMSEKVENEIAANSFLIRTKNLRLCKIKMQKFVRNLNMRHSDHNPIPQGAC